MDLLDKLSLVPIIVILCVIALFLVFLAFYIKPGFQVIGCLTNSAKKIRRLESGQIKEKHNIEKLFLEYPGLAEIWKKYAETLHPQFEHRDGERTLLCLRATMPAESFFSKDIIVDMPLHTDFFKHLPGILTGIGIIGTFIGLINGLEHFHVDTDAEKLQTNLALLLNAVREAFFASCIAIFVAILVTLLEKFMLNLCYRNADELVQVIDTLYEAGAGEEYLSQLVDSASENATQTRLLKDNLVNDLKELLTNFSGALANSFEQNTQSQTRSLIEANQEEQAHFRESLADAMKNSLDGPMQTIVEATKTLGGNQGEAINDLLSAMISRLDDTFGSQMRGLNEMMSSNAELMGGMQQQFSIFLKQLEHAGKDSQTAQSEHLKVMMDQAEDRQLQMNERVNQALLQMSETVSLLMEGLAEQRNAIGDAGQLGLDSVRTGLAALLDELKNTANQTSEIFNNELRQVFITAEQRQNELGTQVQEMIEQMQQNQSTQGSKLQLQFKEALEQVTNIADQMDKRRDVVERERIADDAQRTEKFDTEIMSHVQKIGDSTLRLTNTVETIGQGIAQSVTQLERVTVEGAKSLNAGAEAIRGTSEALDSAGKKVSQVLEQATNTQEKLSSASQSLMNASQSLDKGMLDYQIHRGQVEAMILTLRTLLQEVEQKTGLSQSMVNDMQNMVEQSRQLQIEANQFISQSGEVLKEGFNGFAEAVTTNMSRSRAEFDKGLGQAVEMISGQIQELESVLDQLIRAAGGRKG
jgi:putative membrane protein